MKTSMLLKLFYNLSDIDTEMMKIVDYLKQPIDYTDVTSLIKHREEGRLLLHVASKCHTSINYYYRLTKRTDVQEYATLAAIKEYTEMTKKDLENTILTIHNTINFYKNERFSN